MKRPGSRRPERAQSIPPSVIPQVIKRLTKHAREKYADTCREVRIEAKGPYLYVDAVRSGEAGQDDRPVHLCRLEFIWMGEFRWGFWFYSYAHERYERSVTMKGRFDGTPEECFDCAAFAHLTGDPSRISGMVY
ncbi:MAG: hypothetical protein ACYDFT_03135 [Thermoplasmata archaeon]